MFLKELSEKERKIFLQLALIMAKTDGIVVEVEHELMDAYSKECGMPYDKSNDADPYDLLDELRGSTDRVKRIFIFELARMILADSNYQFTERKFLNIIADSFHFIPKETEKAISLCDKYLSLTETIDYYLDIGK